MTTTENIARALANTGYKVERRGDHYFIRDADAAVPVTLVHFLNAAGEKRGLVFSGTGRTDPMYPGEEPIETVYNLEGATIRYSNWGGHAWLMSA